MASPLAMGLCCALPLLIAGGALGGLGALLGNPWVIGAAVLLVAGMAGWRVRRGRHRDSCCPPPENEPYPEDPTSRYPER